MGTFWASLPNWVQDVAVIAALGLPGILTGWIVVRGFAATTLVRAMLLRFYLPNLVFVLLIAISVAVGVGLTAQERAVRQGSAQAAARFDLILGAPGSEITLMMAAVYLQPSDMPLLTGAQFAEVAADSDIGMTAPIAFGDSFEGAPVVGTTADFVTHLAGVLAEGRMFETESEAVAGAFAPAQTGDTISPAHGQGEMAEEGAHGDAGYLIVGRMAPTGSPWDRAILVPIEGVWEVHGLPNGHDRIRHDQIGPPFDAEHFPGTPAILVRADALWANYALKSRYTRTDMMGIFPGTVLTQIHGLMRDVREAMSLLALMTQGLVVLSVLIGLLLLTQLFARGLALLRAIGAPRRFVFSVVWSYCSVLIAVGALFGLALGWIAARGLSLAITARTDVLVTANLGWGEVRLVTAFVSIALIFAIVPAFAASYRTNISATRS